MHAIFLGSIGTLAETSTLQLVSYNQAFSEAGLSWRWSKENYQLMLKKAGGQNRIQHFSLLEEIEVDVAALHSRKSEIFQQLLAVKPIDARPGVRNTIELASKHGVKLGLVTTTSWDNVSAILRALDMSASIFDVVTTSDTIARAKPAPDAYLAALDYLQLDQENVVAVEDNPDGARAAQSAGLECVGLIGEMHDPAEFSGLSAYQTSLDLTKYLVLQAAL